MDVPYTNSHFWIWIPGETLDFEVGLQMLHRARNKWRRLGNCLSVAPTGFYSEVPSCSPGVYENTAEPSVTCKSLPYSIWWKLPKQKFPFPAPQKTKREAFDYLGQKQWRKVVPTPREITIGRRKKHDMGVARSGSSLLKSNVQYAKAPLFVSGLRMVANQVWGRVIIPRSLGFHNRER